MSNNAHMQGIRMASQILNLEGQAIATVEDLLLQLLKNEKDPIAKELERAIKKGDGCVATIDPKDLPELQVRLKESGLGRSGHPMHFNTRIDENGKLVADVVVLKGDSKLLQEQVMKLNQEKMIGGNIGLTNMERYAEGNKIIYPNVTAIEAQALMDRAEQLNLKYAMQGPSYIGIDEQQQKEGRCRFVFAEKDAGLVEVAKMRAAYDLAGPAGELYKEHLQFENQYKTQAMDAMIVGRLPSDKLVEGSTLVHENGTTLQATKNGLVLTKPNEKPISIKRDDKELRQKVESEFAKGRIAIITPENKSELDKFKSIESKEERVQMIEKIKGQEVDKFVVKPQLTQAQEEEIKKHVTLQQNIEAKLQQEHPALERIPEDIQTSPFNEFMISQNINAEYTSGMSQIELPPSEQHIVDSYVDAINDEANSMDNCSRDYADDISIEEENIFEPEFGSGRSVNVRTGTTHGLGTPNDNNIDLPSNDFTPDSSIELSES